jgi:CubicO group peptidase (beta-lactamase class C family)
MSRKVTFLLLGGVLTAIPGLAQQSFVNQDKVKRLDGSTIAAAEIDATVTRAMQSAGVPGMSLAILNDGQIVYLKGYGLRDKEKNLSLTPQTIMSAASFTKVARRDGHAVGGPRPVAPGPARVRVPAKAAAGLPELP